MDDLRCKGAVRRQVNMKTHWNVVMTNNSYSRFITSFSMPSIALSNSASDVFFQTSEARICPEMNYGMSQKSKDQAAPMLTFKKSLIILT